jgi:hypothetical protein
MYTVAGMFKVSFSISLLEGSVCADPGRYKFVYDNYTSLWNLLDYCATTIPVTQVSLSEDMKPEYTGRTQIETSIWNDCVFNSNSVQWVGANQEQILRKAWKGVPSLCSSSVGD